MITHRNCVIRYTAKPNTDHFLATLYINYDSVNCVRCGRAREYTIQPVLHDAWATGVAPTKMERTARTVAVVRMNCIMRERGIL